MDSFVIASTSILTASARTMRYCTERKSLASSSGKCFTTTTNMYVVYAPVSARPELTIL